MRWKGRKGSSNVEDRRGQRPAGGAVMGGGIGLLVIVGIVMLMGGDPSPILKQAQQQAPPAGEYKPTAQEEELAQFTSVTLRYTEDVWNRLYSENFSGTYREPGLVLFSGAVSSACGMANSAVGPFYCPGDSKVYIDLSFYEQMRKRFGADGDFAQAYVIAHEVGHHVQNLVGIMDKFSRKRQQLMRSGREKEANALTVRLELQADFLAGVWAHHAQKEMRILERGDLEEALNAAWQIGDDTIQKKTQGQVVPDAFTHGTSKQRSTWFRLGYETGNLGLMDTFDEEHFRRVSPR